MALPTGTVTFVFTDIEGSTRLATALGDDWASALADHHRLIRSAFAAAGGMEVHTEGDAFFAVFTDPAGAARACAEAQLALVRHEWPQGQRLLVRMGVHVGTGVVVDDDYVGVEVHRAARVASAAHGGQVLLSEAAAAASPVGKPLRLHDLGPHALRDFPEAQHVFQLGHPDLAERFPPLRTTSLVAHNLPSLRTAFIGRARELDDVESLLETSGLVTIAGPGGVGKTRLAIEAAQRRLGEMADGVWLVELASLETTGHVATAVAGVIGVAEELGRPTLEVVADGIGMREMLLVVDNCEHLIDEAAKTIDRLLHACPALTVLATSREALDIDGEALFRLDPVDDSDAATLFLDRARLARTLTFDDDDHAAVRRICARLEGLPLALEIAAARVATQTPTALADAVDEHLSAVGRGRRTAATRHQTLDALVAWSYDLLDPAERALFRRLAAYPGGFTTDAIAPVAELTGTRDPISTGDVGAVLDRLIARSLVQRVDASRCRQHVTMREFALAQLEHDGELELVRLRQIDWLVPRAYKVALMEAAQDELFDSVDAELETIRAVLGWAASKNVARAAVIASNLMNYWLNRHPREGRDWLGSLLDLPAMADAAPRERAGLHFASGTLALRAGDFTIADDELHTCLRELDLSDDTPSPFAFTRGHVLAILGALSAQRGRLPEARAYLEDAVALLRDARYVQNRTTALISLGAVMMASGDLVAGEQHLVAALDITPADQQSQRSTILNNLGSIAVTRGDFELAAARFEECARLKDAAGDDIGAAVVTVNLGDLAYRQHDYERAVSKYRDALGPLAEARNPMLVAVVLRSLAEIAAAAGDARAAARFLGADEGLRHEQGIELSPKEAGEIAPVRDTIDGALSAEERDAAIAAGRALDFDAAVAEARAFSPAPR